MVPFGQAKAGPTTATSLPLRWGNLQLAKHAVVLGRGNVGLQACEAFLARGLRVTVVVASPTCSRRWGCRSRAPLAACSAPTAWDVRTAAMPSRRSATWRVNSGAPR